MLHTTRMHTSPPYSAIEITNIASGWHERAVWASVERVGTSFILTHSVRMRNASFVRTGGWLLRGCDTLA